MTSWALSRTEAVGPEQRAEKEETITSVAQEIIKLLELRDMIDARLRQLMSGGQRTPLGGVVIEGIAPTIPKGSIPGMGGGVGPDVPAVTIFSNPLLWI